MSLLYKDMGEDEKLLEIYLEMSEILRNEKEKAAPIMANIATIYLKQSEFEKVSIEMIFKHIEKKN